MSEDTIPAGFGERQLANFLDVTGAGHGDAGTRPPIEPQQQQQAAQPPKPPPAPVSQWQPPPPAYSPPWQPQPFVQPGAQRATMPLRYNTEAWTAAVRTTGALDVATLKRLADAAGLLLAAEVGTRDKAVLECVRNALLETKKAMICAMGMAVSSSS